MRLFKHRDNTDVAIEILKTFYVKETAAYKFKVCWWNIRRAPKCMHIQQTIKISKTAWTNDWTPISH